jgi:hypothetical protein
MNCPGGCCNYLEINDFFFASIFLSFLKGNIDNYNKTTVLPVKFAVRQIVSSVSQIKKNYASRLILPKPQCIQMFLVWKRKAEEQLSQ